MPVIVIDMDENVYAHDTLDVSGHYLAQIVISRTKLFPPYNSMLGHSVQALAANSLASNHAQYRKHPPRLQADFMCRH